MPLNKHINDLITNTLDYDMINKWNSVALILPPETITVHTIDNNIADKYIGDFNGLLMHLNIAEDFWHIHAIVNNLRSDTSYNGFININVIDITYLSKVKTIFTNNTIYR